MNLAPTTIVLWPPAGVGTERPPETPDPHVIRLHDLTTLADFWTDARVSLTSAVTMLAGVKFKSAAIVSVSSAPRLNVIERLAASATILVGVQAPLFFRATFAGRPGLRLQTIAPLRVIPTLTSSATRLQVLATTPRLNTGSARLRGQPVARVLTNTPKLVRTAQFFSASGTITVRANSNLVLIGRGATDVLITFNGAEVNTVRLNTLQITDVLNEGPNTATFVVNGSAPAIGTVVRVGLRDLNSQNTIFAGTVKIVEQYYELKPANLAWQVTCEDFTFLINRR